MKRDERSGKMPVVRANFGFFLLLSLALLFDRSGLAVGCICAALLHELGHLLAMAVCGVSVTAVCLCPLGVRIERAEPTSLNRELLINLSGPMVNLLLALVLYRAEKFPFSAVNCVLGLFELCPLPSLDGGQALFCLMQRYFCLRTAQKFCTVVQGITLLAVLALGMLLLYRQKNATLLLLSAVLAVGRIIFKNNTELIICAIQQILLYYNTICITILSSKKIISGLFAE